MSKETAPYGTWPSLITPALLVEAVVRLAHASVSRSRVYWVESRPSDGGREVLVVLEPGGQPVDAIPSGFGVRTQVHEYGGRAHAVHPAPDGRDGADTIVFCNWADQRLWAIRAGGEPEPRTPEPAVARSHRFADPVVTADGKWVLCVRERHGDTGVDNDLVAVPLDPPQPDQPPRSIASGHDFYSSPRLSPDGSALAWITWDFPDMPFDASELWLADIDADARLGPARKVAGGPDVSVKQPRWSPGGVLHYLSDQTGWWNLYDQTGRALAPMEADIGPPDWVFGNADYGFGPDGELVAAWQEGGRTRIGRVEAGVATATDFPFTAYSYVDPTEDGVVAITGSPADPPAVVRLDLDTGRHRVLRRSRELTMDAGHLSSPEHVEFPTGGVEVAHALFYPPAHSGFSGPPGERPPLVVTCHGGPTSQAGSVLNLAIQYWTNRGFAVADVDYRGSSGYGRAYRRRLDGGWGVLDVEDCAAVVAWLDEQGRADGRRAVIRGTSAGGFTTLAALAFTDAFAAGGSVYGVADLELLARDTHKFEARYLDRLVGPWPDAADEYRRRSPIYHVEQIDDPLILFQGLDDMVVPPAQAEMMYEALRDRGVPVAYLPFAGEGHGFRKAETIEAMAGAELTFYGRVLGFTPDTNVVLDIANEANLG